MGLDGPLDDNIIVVAQHSIALPRKYEHLQGAGRARLGRRTLIPGLSSHALIVKRSTDLEGDDYYRSTSDSLLLCPRSSL